MLVYVFVCNIITTYIHIYIRTNTHPLQKGEAALRGVEDAIEKRLFRDAWKLLGQAEAAFSSYTGADEDEMKPDLGVYEEKIRDAETAERVREERERDEERRREREREEREREIARHRYASCVSLCVRVCFGMCARRMRACVLVYMYMFERDW